MLAQSPFQTFSPLLNPDPKNPKIQQDYKKAEKHFIIGYKLQKQGKYEEAIKEYTKSIKLHNKSTEAYTNRGSLKLQQQKFQEAVQDFNEAVKINPKNFLAYSNRGAAKFLLAEYQEAIQDFSQALIINPDDFISYRQLQQILIVTYTQLPQNWDSYGAIPSTLKTAENANEILSEIFNNQQKIFHSAPSPNGDIMIELQHKNKALELECFADGKQTYTTLINNEVQEEKELKITNIPNLLIWLNS